jgi:uncharacterized protein YqjF (DUF2071 family)
MNMTADDFKYIVGKTLDVAKQELPPRYFMFVAENNGQSFYRTQEFNPYRINVWVKNDIIIKVDGVN